MTFKQYYVTVKLNNGLKLHLPSNTSNSKSKKLYTAVQCQLHGSSTIEGDDFYAAFIMQP